MPSPKVFNELISKVQTTSFEDLTNNQIRCPRPIFGLLFLSACMVDFQYFSNYEENMDLAPLVIISTLILFSCSILKFITLCRDMKKLAIWLIVIMTVCGVVAFPLRLILFIREDVSPALVAIGGVFLFLSLLQIVVELGIAFHNAREEKERGGSGGYGGHDPEGYGDYNYSNSGNINTGLLLGRLEVIEGKLRGFELAWQRGLVVQPMQHFSVIPPPHPFGVLGDEHNIPRGVPEAVPHGVPETLLYSGGSGNNGKLVQ